MVSKKINSVDDIQCGFVCKVPLEDEIEFFEKRLIPMIKAEMKLKLAEAKKELKKMKKELKIKKEKEKNDQR